MIAALLLLAAAPASLPPRLVTVGGFSYRIVASDRTKRVKRAPPGYARTWKEHVAVIVPTQARDVPFARFMRHEALRLQRGYYGHAESGACPSFEACEIAGFVEFNEDVIAVSPDLISVSVGTVFYQAGMAHPNVQDVRNYVWSRRMGRLLKQSDVFAVPPDRKLRRLAQAKFDNQEGLQNPQAADGIPLPWDHVSFGPTGITWSFGPYELGGYLSAGEATMTWAELKPYLRRSLPFTIKSIRLHPNNTGE